MNEALPNRNSGLRLGARGLIRSLVLRHQRSPGLIPAEIQQAAQRIAHTAHRFLLASSDPPAPPRAGVAVQIGLLMVMAAIRERVVLAAGPQASTLELSDEAFAAELADALVAYLHAAARPRSRR